jgi:hypothetical protein
VRPFAVFAFGLFAAAIAALITAARKLAQRAEEERAENLLRAQIDALGPEAGRGAMNNKEP